jgi:hypothetical protein
MLKQRKGGVFLAEKGRCFSGREREVFFYQRKGGVFSTPLLDCFREVTGIILPFLL